MGQRLFDSVGTCINHAIKFGRASVAKVGRHVHCPNGILVGGFGLALTAALTVAVPYCAPNKKATEEDAAAFG